jgi:hypothetical protein
MGHPERSVMTIQEFQARWRQSRLKERSAAQSHFNDLCHALHVPTPTEADPNGTFYTFEKGAEKASGGDGWADVWFRGHFAWEYKGKHADLRAAYLQLLQYKDDLENPPLLVVCDLDRFEVHTNFTGTVKRVYRFSLDELDQPESLRVLRAVFTDPEALKPGLTTVTVTEAAAARFSALAAGLHRRGVAPQRAAHFLVQLLFCLFAEDAGLLRTTSFSRMVSFAARHPDVFVPEVTKLFQAMQHGGYYDFQEVPHFNGGLFATLAVAPLSPEELGVLAEAAMLDWSSVEPAIFGTLFERSLDPSKRAQLGAHYTGRADIERVVEPVLMAPLRRWWEVVRSEADAMKAAWESATAPRARDNRRQAFAAKLAAFQQELTNIRVLDPACGSGNFLYVALARLLDLEKEVLTYGATNGLPMGFPTVRPSQLAGLEINDYARELAQTVIWIGYLQWMITNGYAGLRTPILEPLETDDPPPRRPARSQRPRPLEGSDLARSRRHHRQPAVSGRQAHLRRVRRCVCRGLASGLRGSSPTIRRPCLLLLREGTCRDRSWPIEASRVARDELDSRWSESRRAGSDQAKWRHFHGLGRRAVGA